MSDQLGTSAHTMAKRTDSIYACALCKIEFPARMPRDDETNQDVACPYCYKVETHYVTGEDVG